MWWYKHYSRNVFLSKLLLTKGELERSEWHGADEDANGDDLAEDGQGNSPEWFFKLKKFKLTEYSQRRRSVPIPAMAVQTAEYRVQPEEEMSSQQMQSTEYRVQPEEEMSSQQMQDADKQPLDSQTHQMFPSSQWLEEEPVSEAVFLKDFSTNGTWSIAIWLARTKPTRLSSMTPSVSSLCQRRCLSSSVMGSQRRSWPLYLLSKVLRAGHRGLHGPWPRESCH